MQLLTLRITLVLIFVWVGKGGCRKHFRKRADDSDKYCMINKKLNCELFASCREALEIFKNPESDTNHVSYPMSQYDTVYAYRFYSIRSEVIGWFMRSNLPTLATQYNTNPNSEDVFSFYSKTSIRIIEGAEDNKEEDKEADKETGVLYRGMHYHKKILEGKNYLIAGMASFSYDMEISLKFAFSTRGLESSYVFVKKEGSVMRGKDLKGYSIVQKEKEFLSAKDTYIRIISVSTDKVTRSDSVNVKKEHTYTKVEFEVIAETNDLEGCI